MDDIIDDIAMQVRRCRKAAHLFYTENFKTMFSAIKSAVDEVGDAWSGSPLGYHSRVYYEGLRKPPPGCYFSKEWGLRGSRFDASTGDWVEYEYEDVVNEIRQRAGNPDFSEIDSTAQRIAEIFNDSKVELLSALDAVLATQKDEPLQELRDKIAKLTSHISKKDIIRQDLAGQHRSRDTLAINQNIQAPPHLAISSHLMEAHSYAFQAKELAKLGHQAQLYLEKKMKLKGKSIAKKQGKIFIGHGRSSAWRDLKDFLQDRLNLEPDEFNLQSADGMTTKERLEEMLDNAVFAFLVMTAEDQYADETKHARENVIHEAGLSQGRLGFRRVIILLEEGCEEFSNIKGLTQIRFPKDNIKAQSEEIRRVLEREGLL